MRRPIRGAGGFEGRARRAGSGSTSRRPGGELMPPASSALRLAVGRGGARKARGGCQAPGGFDENQAPGCAGRSAARAGLSAGRGEPAQARRVAGPGASSCRAASNAPRGSPWAAPRRGRRGAGSTRARRSGCAGRSAARAGSSAGRGAPAQARHEAPARARRCAGAGRAVASTRADPPHTPERSRAFAGLPCVKSRGPQTHAPHGRRAARTVMRQSGTRCGPRRKPEAPPCSSPARKPSPS